MDESAKETVIIVHGTWAAPAPGVIRWYQPGDGVTAAGGFVSKLDAALQKRSSPARCWAHCTQANQIFHWSGQNSWIARTQAASELGDYVLKLRNEGWRCHIVAHSHGGNVVLEALPQITTALLSNASLGKIVTLGTPFMDTMSPILNRVSRNRNYILRLSWTIIVLYSFLLALVLGRFGYKVFFLKESLGWYYMQMALYMTIFIANIWIIFYRGFLHKDKSFEQPFNRIAQLQPIFLALSSLMDEPWQILHHMRNASNPMAARSNLTAYLISSTQSHILQSAQVAQIFGAKSYHEINTAAKWFVALSYLLILLFVAPLIITGSQVFLEVNVETRSVMITVVIMMFFVFWITLPLFFTPILGTTFYSAFLSPFRWCAHRVSAIKGIFTEIVTYVVRSRGWSVVLAIAMGLEGYRYHLPLIEQDPSSILGNFVKYENMPTAAQQRALAMRGAWIDRHLNNVAQTFSKLVVTSADITLLLRAIAADQTLVHAAYYTDDECIARIADWIAAEDNARVQ